MERVRSQSAPPQTPAVATDMQAQLNRYVDVNPGAALIVAVVSGGQVTTYTAGITPTGLDERTEFQIGSITKTFTATLLALMVRDGSVKLDDPIGKYLAPGVTAPTFQGRPIRLIDLAEQNSGLPAIPDNLGATSLDDPYATYTPAKLHAFLSSYRLTREPGTQYEYSNTGVGLLGDLLAARAKTSYGDLLETHVFHPLGMQDTAIDLSAEQRARLAPGFNIDNDPQQPWDFAELAGAGALYSDMHDMLIYLRANMAAPAGKLGPDMAFAQQPRFPIAFDGVVKIGLVWMTNEKSGITWHNGQTGGYHAFIAFNRAAQTGVVVLANVADTNLDALGTHALAPYFPVPAARAAIALPPEAMDRLTGIYQLAPGVTITIAREGARLTAQVSGQQPYMIYASSPTSFFFRVVDAQLTFDVDVQGRATRVTLHQNGHDIPAARIK